MFGKGFILREENDMIIKSVNLETVCGITSKLPDNTLPEVAFAGKSNVGKSSLINAVMEEIMNQEQSIQQRASPKIRCMMHFLQLMQLEQRNWFPEILHS